MTTAATALPLLALRITAGPVELRGITDDLLGPIADLALDIHGPDHVPFFGTWSLTPAPDMPRVVAQVICAFLIDQVDAQRITSAAFADNPTSVTVSRKTGYSANGTVPFNRMGKPSTVCRIALEPDNLVRYQHEPTVRGLPDFRKSIGLDTEDQER
jgi:hypothetical protein